MHAATMPPPRMPPSQEALDVHAAHTEWPPLHLRRRAAIAEVVLAGGLTIATSQNGVAVAFQNGGCGRVGWINAWIFTMHPLWSAFVNQTPRLTCSHSQADKRAVC